MRLFCDCKTDEEKSNFFLSGMAVETGIIAPAISNDVAMAYHRCAQFKKENDELRAKIEAMEKQKPVASVWRCDNGHIHGSCERTLPMGTKLYLAPGAQPAPIISEGWPTDEMTTAFAAVFSVRDQQATFAPAFRAALAAAPEANP